MNGAASAVNASGFVKQIRAVVGFSPESLLNAGPPWLFDRAAAVNTSPFVQVTKAQLATGSALGL